VTLPESLSSDEPSCPPTAPIRWRGTVVSTHSSAECMARTWFAARAELMATLGAGPDEITVEPVTT